MVEKKDEIKTIELKSIKNLYPGYFYNASEKLMENATLVLDTNIYLNLIDYPTELSEKLISIFNSYNSKSKLFVPGTVGYEVIKQLDSNLNALEKQYYTIDNKLDECITAIESVFNSKGKKSYPIKDNKEILDLITSHFTTLKKEINEKKESKKDKKKLREAIISLMKNVGPCYDDEEKKKVLAVIQSKYEKQLYPGYKDFKKDDITKNNDGFIWQQTIDYSQTNNKDIIFVTADVKEDWFNINPETKERTIKQPMINDFMIATGHKIQLLSLDDYLPKYNKQLSDDKKIDSKAMKDMIEIVKGYDTQKLDVTNIEFINSLDKCISPLQIDYSNLTDFNNLYQNIDPSLLNYDANYIKYLTSQFYKPYNLVDYYKKTLNNDNNFYKTALEILQNSSKKRDTSKNTEKENKEENDNNFEKGNKEAD